MNKSHNKNNVLLYGTDGKRFNLFQIVKNLKFAKQRVLRGYADCDVWNFDKFLYSIIKNGLISLSEISSGYPDRYDNLQSWKDELVRISNIVDEIDMDKNIDEYFDGDEFNNLKYYKKYAKSEILKSEFFHWIRLNIDSLWD